MNSNTTTRFDTMNIPFTSQTNWDGTGNPRAYRNYPTAAQRLLEFFSVGIIGASCCLWLGGYFSIFVCIWGIILGIIGLFAWTKRHVWLFIFINLGVMALAILNIIFRATNHIECVPFFGFDGSHFNGVAAGSGNPVQWCGGQLITYIASAILLFFLLCSMLTAFVVIGQHRRDTGVRSVRVTETRTTTTNPSVLPYASA